jgi:serine/threonine protein phosphatase PrpC
VFAAAAEHIGARKDQQDRHAIFADEAQGEFLLMVADGVGGQVNGGQAAQAVVDSAASYWQRGLHRQMPPTDFLKRLCREAHDAIGKVGGDGRSEPRSTVVVLYWARGQATWAHSGDSRLYHFREGRLLARTRDHSILQILVDRGMVKEEEMGTHPDQGKLVQSLGGAEFKEPVLGSCPVSAQDAFLLCTDGFWEHTTRDEMKEIVRAGPNLQIALQYSTETATRRAGKRADNCTAAVIAGEMPRSGHALVRALLYAGIGLVVLSLVGLGALLVLREKASREESQHAREESQRMRAENDRLQRERDDKAGLLKLQEDRISRLLQDKDTSDQEKRALLEQGSKQVEQLKSQVDKLELELIWRFQHYGTLNIRFGPETPAPVAQEPAHEGDLPKSDPQEKQVERK